MLAPTLSPAEALAQSIRVGTAVVIIDKAANSTTTSTKYETELVVDGTTTTLPTAGLLVGGTLTSGTIFSQTTSTPLWLDGTKSYL